jgi:disulfide bond formation protein DsbB
MPWSFANVIIQIFAGILGGHAAAVVAKEHSFGVLGHTLAGAAGGGLSGLFLQTLASTVVTGTGSLNEPRFIELLLLQALTGAAAGGIATLVVGFLKHSIDAQKK